MTKLKRMFACGECGQQSNKWVGQCPGCQQWNTLTEMAVQSSANPRVTNYAGAKQSVTLIKDVKVENEARLPSGYEELDRVLGGGLVEGSVVLIGGDPGVGKSTILIQTLCELSVDVPALYITGEESLQQVTLRAQRLGLPQDHLKLLAETNIEAIIAAAEKEKPKVMVVDSIQTVFTDLVTSAPGSVSQVRESAAQLVRFAKQTGVALFIVGHVTKEGALAGPRVLEHMVDTVLYFEGEQGSRFRMIRAVKNRFGAVNELGIFAMTDKGLKPVTNPSAIFLSRYHEDVAGSVAMVTWEGSRPILVEVQALVDESQGSNPRRITVGLEQNRLAMLLAVLHRHGGVATYNQDVFVNVVGGVRVTETAADLALVLAVISSLRNQPLPRDLVVFGEVGLAGEIRPIHSGQERLKEVTKHGFKRAIVPFSNVPKEPISGLTVFPAKKLQDALTVLRDL